MATPETAVQNDDKAQATQDLTLLELDELSDEEFDEYTSRSFDEDDDKPDAGSGIEKPAATIELDPPDAASKETPDKDTDEGEKPGDDDDAVIENPFAEKGIPDSLMVDPKTGEQYENGKILGKYETPDDYHEGMAEMREMMGRRTKTDEGTVATVQDEFVPPVNASPDQMSQLDQYSTSQALTQYAGEFDKQGLDAQDYLDDIESLRDVSEGLYYAVKNAKDFHAQTGQRFMENFTTAMYKRDGLNDQAVESAYDTYENAFVEATETQPDDGDRKALRGSFDETIKVITDYDKKVQEHQAQNSGVNIYLDPKVQEFYANYYTVDASNGVPILDPAKVAKVALDANQSLLHKAIRQTAGASLQSKHSEAMAADALDTVAPVNTAASKADDGVTGGHVPVWAYADLTKPDAFDRLVEEYGDEDKAQQVYDKMIDHYDKLHNENPRAVEGKRQF